MDNLGQPIETAGRDRSPGSLALSGHLSGPGRVHLMGSSESFWYPDVTRSNPLRLTPTRPILTLTHPTDCDPADRRPNRPTPSQPDLLDLLPPTRSPTRLTPTLSDPLRRPTIRRMSPGADLLLSC